ncbi:MAG: hypothetical protein Q8P67_01035, partial [archaeon]|nr:hypothetical protein [archaeon]
MDERKEDVAGGRRVRPRERERERVRASKRRARVTKALETTRVPKSSHFGGHFRREFRRVSSIFSAAGDYSIPPSG